MLPQGVRSHSPKVPAGGLTEHRPTNLAREDLGWGARTASLDALKISYLQFQRRPVVVRMRADIADRTPEERFRPCCRYRQFHFPDCVQARRRTCLDGDSVAVGGQRSGCAGGACNSVPFDLSSTDRSAGYCAPIAACSSNQVTRIAKILDARSCSKRQRGRKLFTFRVRIFLTL